MNSAKSLTARFLLGAVALTIALTGCATPAEPVETVSPSPTVTVTPEPSPEPSETATAEPAPEPTETTPVEVLPVTGDVITAEQAENLGEGQKAFTMPDGSLVVVTIDEPLPAPVLEALEAETQTAVKHPGVLGNSDPDLVGILNSAKDFAFNVWMRTGKNVVVIYPFIGGCPTDTVAYLGWMHTNVTGNDMTVFDCHVLPTYEESAGRVADAIAAKDNPDEWLVLTREN